MPKNHTITMVRVWENKVVNNHNESKLKKKPYQETIFESATCYKLLYQKINLFYFIYILMYYKSGLLIKSEELTKPLGQCFYMLYLE